MIRIKEIKGYEGLYFVDTLGNVVAFPKGKRSIDGDKYNVLKQQIKRGYATVNLYNNGKMKTFSVHRLVAEAFLENPKGYPEINHLDEDKKNNRLSNLEWSTSSLNSKHSIHKTTGSKNGFSVLGEDDVLEIVKHLNNKMLPQKEIAMLYNVSPDTICKIKYGKNWGWLTKGLIKEGC